MGRLIYSMITSLDGYVRDAAGNFGWGVSDPAVHDFVTEQFRSVGTYLYGRRMYETMVYWETAHAVPDMEPHLLAYADAWRATEKIVYSTTLNEVASERTRIERRFDPDAVRVLKAASETDLSVDGPDLAAQAIRAGLVDEYQLIVAPVIVGGGVRFFPGDVRADLRLLETRAFGNGVVWLRYGVKGK